MERKKNMYCVNSKHEGLLRGAQGSSSVSVWMGHSGASLGGWRQEGQMIKVILRHIASMRPVWGSPVQRKKNTKNITMRWKGWWLLQYVETEDGESWRFGGEWGRSLAVAYHSILIFLNILFCVYGHFTYMYVCSPYGCRTNPEGGIRSSWIWSH